MVIKERTMPLALQTLNALLLRLSESHVSYVSIEGLATEMQEKLNGKKKLDLYINRLPKSFSILHDVFLNINDEKLQIDTILLTSYGIFIIEVIDMEGSVIYHSSQNHFYLRENNVYLQTYSNENQGLFQDWLLKHGIDGLLLHYYVALPHRNTLIEVEGNKTESKKKLAYADELPIRIVQTNCYLQENNLPNKQLKNRVTHFLLKECIDVNSEFDFPIKYKLNELRPGVSCPNCKRLRMKRVQYKWICSFCGFCSSSAHNKALLEYTLLVDPEISVSACKEFLMVDTSEAALGILRNSNLLKENRKTNCWKMR